MRHIQAFLMLMLVTIILTGCGETFEELKDAAYGINSKADEAASALSMDVHSIRTTEIQFNNQTFTINDLYKTILRDVQWHYEKIDEVDTLTVTGTWKNNGLFSAYKFDEDIKKQLLEHGEITVFLTFPNGKLSEEDAVISMHLNDETVVQDIGTTALHALYDVYLNL
ncbi:23S rRNA methyltransferase [Solibacillus sp. FSL H8-0538]|uniref:23S rRNA methyltransferase n=1 Tax=Solibacillus sp. FSL H8-0538 TaxID=2921400 RepID=UPI0030FBACC4